MGVTPGSRPLAEHEEVAGVPKLTEPALTVEVWALVVAEKSPEVTPAVTVATTAQATTRSAVLGRLFGRNPVVSLVNMSVLGSSVSSVSVVSVWIVSLSPGPFQRGAVPRPPLVGSEVSSLLLSSSR